MTYLHRTVSSGVSAILLLLTLSLLPLSTPMADTAEAIDWVDLIPADDLAALLDPPAYLDEIEDGSFEDQLSSQLLMALESASDSRYHQALVSTQVVEEFDQRNIRLPGFVVPLEMDAQQRVLTFFLVPFFGACIHYPPPPPNQILYVQAKTPFPMTSIYDPVWVEGVLSTTLTENDIARSAYALQADLIELYTE